ncbi:hypothetical protein C8Q78DRAFT_1054319 [Trametes maxima]|nr:hypothetical protein C8Q78DRAFT_1054319 [Trametes maxima]
MSTTPPAIAGLSSEGQGSVTPTSSVRIIPRHRTSRTESDREDISRLHAILETDFPSIPPPSELVARDVTYGMFPSCATNSRQFKGDTVLRERLKDALMTEFSIFSKEMRLMDSLINHAWKDISGAPRRSQVHVSRSKARTASITHLGQGLELYKLNFQEFTTSGILIPRKRKRLRIRLRRRNHHLRHYPKARILFAQGQIPSRRLPEAREPPRLTCPRPQSNQKVSAKLSYRAILASATTTSIAPCCHAHPGRALLSRL